MIKLEKIEDKDYIKALLKDEPYSKADKVGKFDINAENATAALNYLENNINTNINDIETNDDKIATISSDKLFMLDGEMITKDDKEIQLVLNRGSSSIVLISVMLSIFLIGLVLMLFSLF